jgi:hypothetical protein
LLFSIPIADLQRSFLIRLLVGVSRKTRSGNVDAALIDQFGRRMFLKRAVNDYRKQLEQIGVAPDRIESEIAALEMQLFSQPKRLRA